jgi:hypothetical protein
LGTVAAGRRYVGRDIEPRAIVDNQRLAKWLCAEDRVELQVALVEEDWRAQADLVLTSPPYFDREYYGTRAESALRAYGGKYAFWREGFLRALVRGALECAPAIILVVAPITIGYNKYDLPRDVEALALQEGGRVQEQWNRRLPCFGRADRHEKILVIERRS